MLEYVWNAVFFIVGLSILVTFHEWGHYFVAKKLGVGVVRFSIGFGKPLWSRMGKNGTEFVIAAIPLGGYVKMLSRAEQEEQGIAVTDLASCYEEHSPWHRMAISVAGPLANIVLAIILYLMMYLVGIPGLKPVVGDIKPGSVAEQAGFAFGQEITQIDGQVIKDWQDVNLALVTHLGDDSEIKVQVKQGHKRSDLLMVLPAIDTENQSLDLLQAIGLNRFYPLYLNPAANSPASQAGVQMGDKLLAVNGQPVKSWQHLVELVQSSQGQTLDLQLARGDGKALNSLSVTVQPETSVDGKRWVIGIGAAPVSLDDELIVVHHYPLFEALSQGWHKTLSMMSVTYSMLGKLVSLKVSPKQLVGPGGIAKGAGASANAGLAYFLSFLAMISINLAVINLLPIPMLDGGQILYQVIELVRGRPVSGQTQMLGMKLSLVLILFLLMYTTMNDLNRS